MSINNEGTFARMPNNASAPEYISLCNPYTTLREENNNNSYSNENQQNPNIVLFRTENDNLYLLRNVSDRALILEKMGRTVRFLTVIDIIFALFNLFYGFYLSIFTVLCSACGYNGAKNFKRNHVMVYLWYLCLIVIFRLLYPILILQQKDEIDDPDLKKYATQVSILSFILCAMEAIIAYFVYKFYSLLPRSELSREDLLREVTP